MHNQNTIFVTPKLLAQQSDALSSLLKLAEHCDVSLAYPQDGEAEAKLLCKAHPFLCSCLQATEQTLFESVEDKAGTFLLDEGIALSFYCPLELATSSIITLFFHTLSDAIAYIQAFPNPGVQLPKLIAEHAALLAQGKLVAFPTETVYGLGADALNEEAVRSIFTAKQRPFFDPLIVHIADLEQLEDLVVDLDPRAKLLMDRFWPGPLTLILK
ncbi:MAG: Sua5/YciO/YrdC/YwlC family protein, partial [Spirochaetia bacterium]|nr:Sua5/YciO/YrdC/YwlC family protein [Spirochaetia bacterium]